MENIIIAHLNINSLRNKFDALVHIINGNVDILVVVETKLDQTFPENRFRINGFKKPYRRDRTANGGGIMIFVREDIPSLEKTNHTLPHNVEAIFVEINLRKSKFLLIGTYHSTNKDYGTSDAIFLNGIGDAMDVYTCYDKGPFTYYVRKIMGNFDPPSLSIRKRT